MSRDPIHMALQREKKQRVLSETLEMFIRKFQPKELHKQPEFCNELYYLVYHAGDVAAEPFRDIVQSYVEAAAHLPRNPNVSRSRIEAILSPAIDVRAPYAKQMVAALAALFASPADDDDKATGPEWFPNIVQGSDPEAEGQRIVEGLTGSDALANATMAELAAAYVTRSDESYAEFFDAVMKKGGKAPEPPAEYRSVREVEGRDS